MDKRRIIILIIGIITGILTALHDYLEKMADMAPLPPVIKPYLSSIWPVLFVVNAVVAGLTELQKMLEQKDADHPVAPEKQNRRRMLERVWHRWITGVLEPSLHGAALTALGLKGQPGAVADPWRPIFQQPNESECQVPLSTCITQVYNDADGELLILGEPGSGKTTLLLELLRDLLDCAKSEENFPMPILFNLSSWAVKRQPLVEWLVEELREKYQVPQQLAQQWIDADMVLPLLDGLDEVIPAARAACISTINSYRQDHGLVPLVVCCRNADYFALPTRLVLHGAVVVQPLTPQQIDACLSSGGEKFATLRVALHNDPDLQEMATTPLMLSILMLTYSGKSAKDLLTAGTPTPRRQVFVDYVECMLHRRGAETRYTPQRTISWLSWLAQRLIQYNQAQFYLERMQPNWLTDRQPHRYSYQAMVRMCVGLVSGLGAGLFSGLTAGLVSLVLTVLMQSHMKPMNWILSSIIGLLGLLVGLIIGLLHPVERDIKPAEIMAWSWRNIRRSLVQSESLRNGLLAGLFVGLLYGVFIGLIIGLFDGLTFGLLVGLKEGLTTGLLVGLLSVSVSGAISELLGETREKQPRTVPNQTRRHPARNRVLVGLVAGLITELLMMLGVVLLGGELFYYLVAGLPAGLIIGLITAFTSQVETEKKSVELFTWLWVSTGRSLVQSESLRNGLLAGLLYGLFVKLFVELVGGLPFGLFAGLLFGGLLSVSVSGAISKLLGETREKQPRAMPNQTRRHPARNRVLVGLVAGLITGLPTTLLIGLLAGLLAGLDAGLVTGLFFGLPAGLIIGLITAFTSQVETEKKPSGQRMRGSSNSPALL